jgi:hypothetical protein
VTNGVTETADGLQVGGTARVIVDVTSGDPVHFDGNAASGIYVTGGGTIGINGTPGVGGAGTVTANDNGHSGIWIEQEPGVSAGSAINVVSGFVGWANANDGIRVGGNSTLSLRNSYLLANTDNGVYVFTHVAGATRYNSVALINLGTAISGNPSPGVNTLQASAGNNPNLGAGVCLDIDPVSTTLQAAGNIFSGPTDCRTSTATLKTNRTCSNGVDYSVTGPLGATANKVNLTTCK